MSFIQLMGGSEITKRMEFSHCINFLCSQVTLELISLETHEMRFN